MKPCWCKFVMSVLIIVFLWMDVSWAKIGITVVAGLIAVMSLWGGCCCKSNDKCREESKK